MVSLPPSLAGPIVCIFLGEIFVVFIWFSTPLNQSCTERKGERKREKVESVLFIGGGRVGHLRALPD